MSRSRRRFLMLGCLASLALPAAGCGSETATLTGTVRYKGQVVPGGSVILYCSDKQIVRGIIDAEGRFTIPNVPHGLAKVTVQSHARSPAGLRTKQNLPPHTIDGPMPPAVESDSAKAVMPLPPRYAIPEESGLSVTVDRDRVVFEIDLTP